MKNILAVLALILAPVSAYAAAFTCDDYAGTWRGTLVDNGKLFGDGGPWQVTMSLYQHGGKIWGRTSAVKTKNGRTVFPANEIWARCQSGKLQDIFWGTYNHCGALSQQGGLVNLNQLTLHAAWENAMTGTDLVFNLQRKNKLTPYFETAHVNAYNPGKITTCH